MSQRNVLTSAKAMVYTMITSKLDYCNAILYGLPESTLKHFTRVQNLSARFISQNGKYEHITPVLKKFHFVVNTSTYSLQSSNIDFQVVKRSGNNLP